MNYVVLVDEKDQEVGREEKIKAHLGEGKLHRAFSVFVFNNKGELLIQKRAKEKMLWGEYWSNTCCSHPAPNEDLLTAGKRRLFEELGFSCELEEVGSFVYSAKFKDIGSENEFCYVLKGIYNGEVNPSPEEVEEMKWISLDDLKKEVEKTPEKFTPWFIQEIRKFF
jgi:isopentenyl-diphosphate delta-isomerase